MMCRNFKMLAATMVAVIGLATGAFAQKETPTTQTWTSGATTVTLDEYDRRLTVSGSGAMANYSSFNDVPWHDIDNISRVVVEDGVTSIGDYSFFFDHSIQVEILVVSPPALGSNVFSPDILSGCLWVPRGASVRAYRSANDGLGWGGFGCIQMNVTWIEASVVFDPTGGTVSPTGANTANGGFLDSLPTPVRDGYKFIGWFTAETGGNEVTTNTEFLGGGYGLPPDVIYAQWEPIAIIAGPNRIVFSDADGGTQTPTQGLVNGRLASLPTPRRVGYIFNGWFTSAEGGDMVTTNTMFPANGYDFDVVYARWRPAVWDVGAETGTVTATLSEDGTLTISGSGAMADYVKGAAPAPHLGKKAMAYAAGGLPPWYDFMDVITGIVIEDGVDHVGENAFDGAVNTTSLTVGKGVTSIGAGAFSGCSALDSIAYLGETPPSIAPSAFAGVDMESVDVFVPRSAAGAYQTALSGQGLGNIKGYSSVSSGSRVIPQAKPKEEATVIAPVTVLSGEFTAGPNPVLKQSGIVNFFRQGKRVSNSELRIYDATGNVISKVKISDKTLNSQAKRQVGTWDLTDSKGRPVSEGTYLVKGVLKTSDGKSEKVSVILSVR